MGKFAGVACLVLELMALGLLAAGCAAVPQEPDAQTVSISDPLEPVNRFFFDINQRLDRYAARPAANVYRETVPHSVRSGLHNVLDNLGGPVSFANNLLQIRLDDAGLAAGRFLVNSTVGVAGIFDVATDWGLPARNRDFGETMGTYGVPAGPYLVLPFRGSTDVRDFAGNYLDGYATPLRYVRYDGRNYVGLMKSTLGSMDNRAANLASLHDIERASVDFYATTRTLYLERRARLIENRSIRTAQLPDF